MAAQPIHLYFSTYVGCWLDNYGGHYPTSHVCFAIDDLPELAADIANIDTGYVDIGTLRAAILRRLRGTAPGPGDATDTVPG